MTDASSFRRIQSYCPAALDVDDGNVSVSGIDLSRDQQELLVSYESDQIYTFPVFPESNPFIGPSIADLQMPSEEDLPLVELASYGAHLNRFTFLKVSSDCLSNAWINLLFAM